MNMPSYRAWASVLCYEELIAAHERSSIGRNSMNAPPPRYATPPVRRGIRRVRCIRIDRSCSTLLSAVLREWSRCLPGIRSCRRCRCSMSMVGAFRMRRRLEGRSWFCPARAWMPQPLRIAGERTSDGDRRRSHDLDRADAASGARQSTLSTLKRILVGGSAMPQSLIARFDEQFGIEVRHAWGMTETVAIATMSCAEFSAGSLAAGCSAIRSWPNKANRFSVSRSKWWTSMAAPCRAMGSRKAN